MADIVNLNRVRKKKAAAAKEKSADANRAKFGRTKSDKRKEKLESEQRDRNLDGHHRDNE